MRHFYLLLLFWLTSITVSYSQPYGNEWIDYSQKHCKVKVNADGWYRISYAALRGVYPDISFINPADFVMYYRGKTVPIFVSANIVFTNTDYIEFFGQKNDGALDSALYAPGNHTNPNYSLFTDSSVYFLTLRPNTANPRYVEIVNNLSGTLPPKESYFYHTATTNYLNAFSEGKPYLIGLEMLTRANFEGGEGWGSGWINPSSALFNTAINTTAKYTDPNLPATITYSYHSFSDDNHIIDIKYNGSSFYSSNHVGYKFDNFSQTIANSNVLATNTISFDEQGTGSSGTQNKVHFASLKYPRQFVFDSTRTFGFTLIDNNAPRYLEITRFLNSNSKPILYDVTNGLIIKSIDSVNSYPKRFLLPAYAGERKMYMRADVAATLITINTIDTIRFTDFSQSQGDYILLTNRDFSALYNQRDYTEEYAKYRRSANGGGHQVVKVYIDEIYDQFNYGTLKSPLAVQNFITFAKDKWTQTAPKYLFILAKGRMYQDCRNNASAAYKGCYVPTFGSPPSDYMLSATRSSNIPRLAVGRVACLSAADIKIYLDKIKEYETQQRLYKDPYQTKKDKLWMKNVLHFSGGKDAYQQAIFKYYLDQYRAILEDSLWGVKVDTFVKKYNVPIDNSMSNLIKQKVNNGVSLMTFFGHSAAASFEFDINPVNLWTNKGKYPVILSNGCYSGQIHAATAGYPEQYTLTADKGIIALMATPSVSVSDKLHNYSTRLMKGIAISDYNQPLGIQMQNTAKDIFNHAISPVGIGEEIVAQEMTLHGDPALKLNQYDSADYQIDSSSILFSPEVLDASLDSFDVNIDITNLGKAFTDTIAICFTRSIKDINNQTINYNYRKFVKAPYYRGITSFRLPTRITPELGLGENAFSAFVECDNITPELSETNNGYQRNVSILAEDIIPIFPYEFAIVPKQYPTLAASTVNPFAPLLRYRFQIDTTERFNSPLLTQTTVTQVGGVVHWHLPIVMKDSTVYYWRVSKDSLSPNRRYNWKKSSFLYLKDEYPGWNQSHYFQYLKNSYPDYVYLDTTRIFKFVDDIISIGVTSGWCDMQRGPLSFFDLGWSRNSVDMHVYGNGHCGHNAGLTFAVIDSATGQNMISKNNPGQSFDAKYGNYHCANNGDQYGFDFHIYGMHPSWGIPWGQVVSRFLDSIPPSSYVLMYSTNVVEWYKADSTLMQKLAAMGAISLPRYRSDSLKAPYICFTQKGNPGFANEVIGSNYNTAIYKNYALPVRWYQGTYKSKVIGPAREWGSMHWRYHSLDNPSIDSQYVTIIGIDNNGNENEIHTTTTLDSTINWINPVQYPYIRLKFTTKDNANRTPSQLDYWRVLYKKVPEAAINPAAHFVLNKDSFSVGDTLRIEVALENVTEYDMDSMYTYNKLENLATNTNINTPITYDSLLAFDTIILKYNVPINSNLYDGNNKITIEANPENITEHQLEQYHFNNYAILKFFADEDRINPLLDVTFDGRHILNGDLVSSKPKILISLKDENKYLALNDTSLMQVYLRYPGETQARKIQYDNQIMTFFPATGNISKNNQARIELNPELLADGTYELLVKDEDRNGNNSSNNDTKFLGNSYYDYRIMFEVMNKSTISNVLNYPNPFSTATRFVFTVTGSEIPDYMKIQIMTVTGKVVKEITKEELGPIRVGTNITEYAWDGRDQYGDKLANGVYFYRVITKLHDDDIERLQSSSRILQQSDFDKYFKKGFGKMVILR